MASAESQEYLFVYGTLRRKVGHPMHRVLAREASYAGPAVMQGRLYDLGAYPGFVLSEDPEDRVVGELYRLNPGAAVLERLDRYEGIDPQGDPETQTYRRVRCTAVGEDGRSVEAWTYLYNRDVARLRPIPSGDYVAYVRPKEGRR